MWFEYNLQIILLLFNKLNMVIFQAILLLNGIKLGAFIPYMPICFLLKIIDAFVMV